MADAFICDYRPHADRPLRRRACRACAPTIWAPSRCKALDGAQPEGRSGRRIDDVVFGCANQAGEDNRNVARMALLLAGLPASVPATTVNRLCGSGMDAVAIAARSIKAGEAELVDRRRRRIDEPRALRHAEGRDGLLAQRRDLRHDDRLALRQPG